MTIGEKLKQIIEENLTTMNGLTIHTHNGITLEQFIMNNKTTINTCLIAKFGWVQGQTYLNGTFDKELQYVICLRLLASENNETVTDELEDILMRNHIFTIDNEQYYLSLSGAMTPFADQGLDIYELNLTIKQ